MWWQDVVPGQPTKCEVAWRAAEDPLFKVSEERRKIVRWAWIEGPSWVMSPEASQPLFQGKCSGAVGTGASTSASVCLFVDAHASQASPPTRVLLVVVH